MIKRFAIIDVCDTSSQVSAVACVPEHLSLSLLSVAMALIIYQFNYQTKEYSNNKKDNTMKDMHINKQKASTNNFMIINPYHLKRFFVFPLLFIAVLASYIPLANAQRHDVRLVTSSAAVAGFSLMDAANHPSPSVCFKA